MRSYILPAVGVALIVAGVWFIYAPLALVLLGAGCLFVDYVSGGEAG